MRNSLIIFCVIDFVEVWRNIREVSWTKNVIDVWIGLFVKLPILYFWVSVIWYFGLVAVLLDGNNYYWMEVLRWVPVLKVFTHIDKYVNYINYDTFIWLYEYNGFIVTIKVHSWNKDGCCSIVGLIRTAHNNIMTAQSNSKKYDYLRAFYEWKSTGYNKCNL